jgi:tRNA(fMet)-specific endonuclease VapC
MIAFDADVLSELFAGAESYVRGAEAVPVEQHAITVVVLEEILRGRLNQIRRAEAGKSRISIERAYDLLQGTVQYIQHFLVLPYTSEAERLYQGWRQHKVRVGTRDLRIAATCVANSATLISRNRRDFELVPDLSVQFWE